MNLDDVIPDPQFSLSQSRIVDAPPAVVWDELHRVTMAELPVARAMMGLRYLPVRLVGRQRQGLARRTFLDATPIPVLHSDPPRLVLLAGLSQAWRLLGGSKPPVLDGDELRVWSRPGWIKVGMEFRLQFVTQGTVLSSETRVLATDPRTRRIFAAYWLLIRPSSDAIRREVITVVARRAESLEIPT